jgi:hypothetical protein
MFVLNITLPNELSEDETLEVATLGHIWCCTLREVTEQSCVTQPSVIEFLYAACAYLVYANRQYLLVEENRVNDCVRICGIG